MAARFPFTRILVADIAASPDHGLWRYGAWLAGVGGGAVERVSHRDLGAVLAAAAGARADLLLLRDPQRWPEGRQLARRMVDRSPCSVWMVPAGAQPPLRRVVVDVGSGTGDVPVLGLVSAIARRVGVESLVAVRVTQAVGVSEKGTSNRDVELEGLVARHHTRHLHCSVHLDHTHDIASLRRAAEQHRADLLVVAAPSDTSRRWPDSRSDANELVGNASTAFLSLHASAVRPSLRARVRRLFADAAMR